MRFILEGNSFKFNEKHFVQTRGIAMGTEMAVASMKTCKQRSTSKVCSQSRRKIANDLFLLATSSVCVHAFLSATKLNKLPLIICLRSFIYTTNLSVNSFIANVEADDSKTLYKYLKLLTSNLYSSLID